MEFEAPFTHPVSCPVVRLASVTRKIGSGATPTGGEANYLPTRSRYALVRSQNVFDRVFDAHGLAYISDEQAERLKSAELQPGDVLLNITGDGVTFGRACIVSEAVLPACVNQHVCIVRVDPTRLEPGYLLAFLTHSAVKIYIESFNAGGSRRAITKGHIESFCIPLPPLAEQRAIAAVLGSLDDKIELNRRINETLEAMARALFKSWFVDFDPVRAKLEGRAPAGMDAETAALFPDSFEDSELGPIPKGWALRCLADVQSDNRGTAAGPFGSNLTRRDYVDVGVPVIRGSNMHSPWFMDRGFVCVSSEKAEGLLGNMAHPGDVLFTQRGTLGQVSLIPEDARYQNYVLSQSQMKLTPAPWMPPEYVYFAFAQPRSVEYIVSNATSSGVPHINLGFLRGFPLLVPGRGELAAFRCAAGPLLRHVLQNDRESATLGALRDLLLPRLLSGELRVKDAAKLAEAAL